MNNRSQKVSHEEKKGDALRLLFASNSIVLLRWAQAVPFSLESTRWRLFAASRRTRLCGWSSANRFASVRVVRGRDAFVCFGRVQASGFSHYFFSVSF